MLHSATGLAPAAARSKLVLEQATAALQAGDRSDAERMLRAHVLDQPRDAAALAKLVDMALEEKRVEEATILLRRAVSADPNSRLGLFLVDHLRTYAGPGVAMQEIQALPPAVRHSFDGRASEAALLGVLGEHDREIGIYKELVREQPANPALWKSIGDALKTVGRIDEAVAALRRAVESRPTYGEAYWTLANFKSFRFTDRDISAMKKALRGKLSDDDALHFHFALGKAYEDRDAYPQSFKHYEQGNRIRAGNISPELMRVTRFTDVAIATFTPALFERHAGGSEVRDPIFVLGIHRSGSTLVEQILASHPMIEGTTEITIIQQLWDRLGRIAAIAGRGTFEEIARLNSADIEAIGAEYMERTRPFRMTDRPFFVDKLPANWMNVGLIRLALPNAKIIDARRHPMACGFSNFKQHYAAGVTFSYSLESIGYFYRDYVRMMAHFDTIQPGAIHRIINERLIDDPEGEVRRMLDYLGVPFDPACLKFHLNTRAVSTPSAEQVRRPINRDGVDYWRRYEPWLGSLKEALGEALENWDKPPH